MPETQIVVDGKKLSYEGLFDAKELYNTVDELMAQHTFDKNEFLNSEHVYNDSKQIEMELRPYKKFSDYVKVELKILITGTNLKSVEIEKKGVKKKLLNGKVIVQFYGYLITDYEASWEMRPFYYLMRMLIDKFIYKGYLTEAKNQLISVTNEVYDEIRSYLNMHRYIK